MFGKSKPNVTQNCTIMANVSVTCQSQTEKCLQCSDSALPPVSKFTQFKRKVSEATSLIGTKIKNGLQAIRDSISPPKNKLPMPDPCDEARKFAMNCAIQNTTCCCQPLN